MLNRIICCLILSGPICTIGVRAQDNFIAEGKTSVVVFDPNGKPFANPPMDIAGTPFLQEEWRPGSVIISSNKRYDSVKLRFNLVTQEFHFMNKDNLEIALFKGYVKSVRFYDAIPGITSTNPEFQAGFPPIDQQDEGSFYQVVCKGKMTLLKSLRKVISQEKNGFSGEIKKEYVSYEDYYTWNSGKIERVKKDKSAALDLLADQKGKIDDFVSVNHLKMKSIDDIRKVIDYYNSL
jgi:hypothetical protein